MVKILKDKLKALIDRIPENKRPMILIVCGLLLMLLIVIPELLNKSDNKKEIPVSQTDFYDSYARQTEDELGELIESINGAGKTKVFLTLESGEENIYAYDINGDKTEYVVIKDNSNENGMLLKIIKPKIRGVAVVCEGGDSTAVKIDIINAISSSLGVSSAKISIAKMKRGANDD